MGTYYHGNSEIHGGGGGGGDGLQTLILMNPAYVGYSEAQQSQQPPSSNFVFLNPTSSGSTVHHAPPSNTQHFVGVPLQGANSASPQNHQHQDASAHGFLPHAPYNLYNLPMDNAAARDVTRTQNGLSLTLSSQPPPGYGSFRQESEVIRSRQLATAVSPPQRGEDIRVSAGSPSSATASGVSNGVNGVQNVLLNSKYLKAAQELLEVVVNVGKCVKTDVDPSKEANNEQPNKDSAAAASGDGSSGADSGAKRAAELTTAERQEIQMKKAKLVNMLDEVEQRYRQYHHQMQIVISWFEQAAGIRSAKTYTALALETISKQFRCLKDAIIGQIRGVSKSLGEEESLEGRTEGSRLKYVDNQIRQQRALQQLGMIQHNAWRPQRGLPERSVSVLRAWLFEHFLHPYPKDSDKMMLAKQTGLTRSQVSNWFINARVRLWKPMVEEMYTEEMKDHDKNGAGDNKPTKTDSSTAPPGEEEQQNKNFIQQNHSISTPSPSPTGSTMRNMAGFNLISEMESINQSNSPKKMRIIDSKPMEAENDAVPIKFGEERESRDGFTLMGAPTNFIGGFGSYPMAELGRFGAEQFQPPYSGNGVSLTLGLPHCENLSISGTHQQFMPKQSMQLGRGVEIGEANDYGGMSAAASNGGTVYENLSIQNRKRFAAQLLPDFVA